MAMRPAVGVQVPVALACSAPEARVQPALEAAGLLPQLAAVITAEDVARGRPDPDGILYAAQQLQRPPIRCVLVGACLAVPVRHTAAVCMGDPVLSMLLDLVSISVSRRARSWHASGSK